MSTNASFGFSVCGFRWRAPVLKHEWILNCTSPTRFLGKRIEFTHRSNLTLPASVGFRIHSKFQDTDQKCRNRLFLQNSTCSYWLTDLRYSRRSPIGQLLDCDITGHKYPYSLTLFIRLPPSTSLIFRGETLFHFPLIIIQS